MLFYAVAAETYWWMLAQLQMEESFQHSRNDCYRWENGCLSMVRLFTALSPGELRMIPLTKMCGKFKIFTKAKIGPLVHFSTGKLASFSESRRVHTKDANCTAGKCATSVIILLLLIARLLLALGVPLLFPSSKKHAALTWRKCWNTWKVYRWCQEKFTSYECFIYFCSRREEASLKAVITFPCWLMIRGNQYMVTFEIVFWCVYIPN